jgi:hypothetical protein
MLPPSAKCPKCSRPSLILWCHESSAYCDQCSGKLSAVELDSSQELRLLFAPVQSPTGVWTQPSLDFAVVRRFAEACLRPWKDQELRPFLSSSPGAIAQVIETLETLIPAPWHPYSDPRLKGELQALATQIAATRAALAQAQRALNKAHKRKKAVRYAMEVVELRKKLAVLISERERLASGENAATISIRRNAIRRIRHDFDFWQRGLLEVEFQTPVHRVYWELLKPSGDSWAELVRHFEYLSRIRGEQYDIQRIKLLRDYKPDDIYVGRASFEGYVVFCYDRADTAALECPKVGNALYFMALPDWRFLSQLSKTELLDHHRPEIQRFIHSGTWQQDLQNQMRNCGVYR